MKHLVRTVLGGNPPGQSRAEIKFRSNYHLDVRDVSNPSYPRWTGTLKRGKDNILVATYSGVSAQHVSSQAKADVDQLWARHRGPITTKKVKRL